DRLETYRRAQRAQARRDAILKGIIKRVGHCTLTVNPDGFGCLVHAIISQQISGKAAASIAGRVVKTVKKLTPKNLLAARDEDLRAAGLSAGKLLSLRDLAEKVHNKTVPLARLQELDDEEVIARLIPVRGIGRWTAEMFLIFSLGRLDVLPVADLGLRAGLQRHYGLADLPDKEELTEQAEPWRPYRSIATWYLWRSLGPVPQS
ncbi:MAG: DNA-3-methyladenine glycosylase, partial [Gemmataceae bacterium]